MEMVALWDRRDSKVSTFSGGMKRRLEIARGLLHSPACCSSTSPRSGSTRRPARRSGATSTALPATEDITIFMTTHYMDEAEYCDRIAIIDHGEIVVIDSPEALKASIGKDRVQIHTSDDQAAIAALKERFDLDARRPRRRGDLRGGLWRGVRAETVRRTRACRSRGSACAGRRSTTCS